MLMADEKSAACVDGLKEIMVGGEAFPEVLLSGLRKHSCARMYNMYGPTETTVWSTVKELTQAESIDIGTPITNTRIYILGKNNEVQAVGIRGELCIAGDGLARGYFNETGLTAEKFVENPFEPGNRMYKTGDLVRWLPDGNIEFLGRMDHQVKIRGYRIELGEIENRLMKYPAMKEIVVIDRM